MADLQHLKDLHAHTEARDLTTTAHATMLRTAQWENSALGGIAWSRRKKNSHTHNNTHHTWADRASTTSGTNSTSPPHYTTTSNR